MTTGKGKTELAVKIDVALEQDERTADAQIEATDNNGVITLTGLADSNEARMAAGEIAESFDEALSIVNDIDVEGKTTSSDKRDVFIPTPINNQDQ